MNNGKKKEAWPLYALSVSIVVAVIAVMLLYFIQSGKPTVGVQQSGQPIPANENLTAAEIEGYLNGFNLPTGLAYYPQPAAPDTLCPMVQYYKWYIQKGMSSPYSTVNESLINMSEPFAEYLIIYVVNSSYLPDYKKGIAQGNMTACDPYHVQLDTNSTFTHVPANFSTTSGYMWEYSNFTPAGLAMTSTTFTGNDPNIEWYHSVAFYRNVEVSVGFWGFAGHMHAGDIFSYTNATLESLEQYFG